MVRYLSLLLFLAFVSASDIAIITVGDTSAYTNQDLNRINSIFRSHFANITSFKVKDEMLVNHIIESYKRSASACSYEECQIEIGKKLGVEWLIFMDVANYPKETTVSIFLRNIARNELEFEYSYDVPHKDKDDMIDEILDNITDMVDDFWARCSPSYITITTNVHNVKAEFELLTTHPYRNKYFTKRLPIVDSRIYEGSYSLSINKKGYKKYKTEFYIGKDTEYLQLDVLLKEKFSFKKLLTKNSKNVSVQSPENVNVKEELMKYKGLLDDGLITQEDYDAKKKELLGL